MEYDELDEEFSRDEIFQIMWRMYQPEEGVFCRWHGAQLSWIAGGYVVDETNDILTLLHSLVVDAPQDWHDTFAFSFTEGVEL